MFLFWGVPSGLFLFLLSASSLSFPTFLQFLRSLFELQLEGWGKDRQIILFSFSRAGELRSTGHVASLESWWFLLRFCWFEVKASSFIWYGSWLRLLSYFLANRLYNYDVLCTFLVSKYRLRDLDRLQGLFIVDYRYLGLQRVVKRGFWLFDLILRDIVCCIVVGVPLRSIVLQDFYPIRISTS